jgi:hypothetical protein
MSAVCLREFAAVGQGSDICFTVESRDKGKEIECYAFHNRNPGDVDKPVKIMTVQLNEYVYPDGTKQVFLSHSDMFTNGDFPIGIFSLMTNNATKLPDSPFVTSVVLGSNGEHGTMGMGLTVTTRFGHLMQAILLHGASLGDAIRETYGP